MASAPDELDAAYDPYAAKSVYIEDATFDVFIRSNYREFLFGQNGVVPFSLDRLVILASKRQRIASLIKGELETKISRIFVLPIKFRSLKDLCRDFSIVFSLKSHVLKYNNSYKST